MMLKDHIVHDWLGDADTWLHYPLPVGLGIAITALGWWFARRRHVEEIPEDTRWRQGGSRR
jgi:hypothetical protein